jgi:hypothetical protein
MAITAHPSFIAMVCVVGSVPRRTHVDFTTQTKAGRPALGVDVEHDPLALTQHAEDRSVEGIDCKVVVGEVAIAHDDAISRHRVVSLDHSLHEGEGTRSCPAQPALTILPDLIQPVQTFTRLGEPFTMARTR